MSNPVFDLGACMLSKAKIQMSWDQLSVHMAILGGSGRGKSKALELLMRQLMEKNIGFMYLDPHGDTAKDIVSYSVALGKSRGDKNLWRKVHYFAPSPNMAVALDPFADAPKRTPDALATYGSWIDTKVDFVVRAILRNYMSEQLDIMKRLKRWLTNALHFCGTSWDDQNSHFGMGHMMTALMPASTEFPRMYSQVRPFLRRDVRNDFDELTKITRPSDREKLTESSFNQMREIFNTVVTEMFSLRKSAMNVAEIMRKNEWIIADLGQTVHCGVQQKLMLGGMLIQEVLHAKYIESDLPENQRRPFVLIIDEAGEFLGEDLKNALKATRKYKLPIVLAAQSLATFAKGDLDLAPEVLSLCNTVITFQQTYRKDKEILADRLGTGNIDFTPLMQEVQRQRGMIEMTIVDPSYTVSRGSSSSRGGAESSTEAQSLMMSEMVSMMRSYSSSVSKGQSHSTQFGENDNAASGFQLGSGMTAPLIDMNDLTHVPAESLQNIRISNNKTKGTSTSVANVNSETETEGEVEGYGNGQSRGMAMMRGRGQVKNWSLGDQLSFSKSLSFRTVREPNIVDEMEWRGLYERGSREVQMEILMQGIHCLSTAEAIISLRDERLSKQIKIHPVPRVHTPEDQKACLDEFKRRIQKIHPYYFNPNESMAAALAAGRPEPAPEAKDANNPFR